MFRLISSTVLAIGLATITANAVAQQQSSETRAVDARITRIKLGGVIDLRLKQGPVASLLIVGDARYVPKVVTTQRGDTLLIELERERHLHVGKDQKDRLSAELTLPNFTELVSQGVGAAEISGFTGQQVHLALDGAGTVVMTSRYHNVDARLSGVGSMTLHTADSDKVDLNLRGAGQIEINGSSRLLTARLGGVGSLEARELRADSVDLKLTGLGSATVFAKNHANLILSGLGSATVYGKPATRKATSTGLGSVNWD
ncbi:GIN domain-containing protein [Massilia sp. PWRC2]|uniref:GIN domain-containing protein n=1 Tax=Massilia sp. PWRC2 TaxID=2804626 RepID=UPI003CF3F034